MSCDLSGESKAFVQEVNAELPVLPRAHDAEEVRKAAVAILRRHGCGVICAAHRHQTDRHSKRLRE